MNKEPRGKKAQKERKTCARNKHIVINHNPENRLQYYNNSVQYYTDINNRCIIHVFLFTPT